MKEEVYVYFENDEPAHVYTSLEPLFEKCKQWHAKNYYNPILCYDFISWMEDHGYMEDDDGVPRLPTGEEEDAAWERYIESVFYGGEWGNCYYVSCPVD